MSMNKSLNLARELEFEYPCERCHGRPAVVIFDHACVCAACHRVLDRELVAGADGRSK
jgi:hypothetical protein